MGNLRVHGWTDAEVSEFIATIKPSLVEKHFAAIEFTCPKTYGERTKKINFDVAADAANYIDAIVGSIDQISKRLIVLTPRL